MEDDLKILKLDYRSNHCKDCDVWVHRGKLEENSEEISSVALLSSACFYFFQTICFWKAEIELEINLLEFLGSEVIW
jgi:hypothetical protein